MSAPVKDTVQSMIDCNAGMVFYYAHSKPELKRMVHPILIVSNHVVCVEADTGKHKRFKLDGIKFPVDAEDEVQEITVEDIINEHIKENKPLTFTYTHNSPYEHRYNKVYTVEPSIIKDDLLITREFHDGANNFFVKYIKPCKKVGSERSECEGCINECANQQGHMGFGGCLSDERITASIKEPKIVSKRHFWDCGYGWNYDNDCCECGERGWAHVWYDDGHKEVLNNM
jgi:hypothetical protein